MRDALDWEGGAMRAMVHAKASYPMLLSLGHEHLLSSRGFGALELADQGLVGVVVLGPCHLLGGNLVGDGTIHGVLVAL